MTATDVLGGEVLVSLAGLHDPIGILSIYVDADPRDQTAIRPPWAIEVENGLRELRERVKDEGPRERWMALSARLGELEPELQALVDARETVRGRALFAPVSGGEPRTVVVQLPLPTCVVLEQRVHLAPLLAAFDEGSPRGIVLLSQAGVRMLEQRLGFVEEVAAVELEVPSDDWREMKGPADPNPTLAQKTASQRDRFERRRDEQLARRLHHLDELDSLITSRGWSRVAVVGDARLTQPVCDHLSSFAGEITVVDRTIGPLRPAEVGEILAGDLHREAERRARALAERAVDTARGGGAATLGRSQTLAALAEGRVSHLLFDAGRVLCGATEPVEHRPEGAPQAEEQVAGTPVEGMIERALETGARVTPLNGSAAEVLAAYDGVAALLRW